MFGVMGDPSAPAAPPDAYVGICRLAAGGMGYVELVARRNEGWERLYARKRLHAHYREDPGLRDMFLDEARLAGLVRHPNVVRVLDVGSDAEGPFLVMEYVSGITAGRLLALAESQGKGVPVQVAARIGIEAGRGLHAAHEATGDDGRPLGLVHRDVSAQNILIGFDGRTQVTDFGIAKAFGNVTRTTTGMLKGNLGYMSPEQLRFELVDRRADIFALGVVLHELLAGERLYANRGQSEGPHRILNEPPPDLAEVCADAPAELVELLFAMLAKARDARPPTAEAVAVRLEAVLARLLEEEDPLDIAEYLSMHFEDVRRQEQLALAAHLARVSAPAAAPSATASPRRRARAALAVAVAAAAAVAVVALSWRPSPPGAPGAAAGSRPGERRSVWAGSWHSCATGDGTLHCWGKNNQGQLGVGNTLNWANVVPLPAIRNPVAVSLAAFHSCACTPDGKAYCWGRNVQGQLGTGTATQSITPVPVADGGPCADVAAGNDHSCLVRKNGTVACWGGNKKGQAGQPPLTGIITSPSTVAGLTDVVQIAASEEFTCALRRTGEVLCFGDNSKGQLGDSTTTSRHQPAPVAGLVDAVEVTAGALFACARRRTGHVVCWGWTADGQTRGADSSSPYHVRGIEDAVQISAGWRHACILRRRGQLLCWGSNGGGQLGIGDSGMRSANDPVAVADVEVFLSVSAGTVHTCGRHPRGVACWGSNNNRQLGDYTHQQSGRPVSVAHLPDSE
jgi:serine/threonine-protein kinase